MLVYAKDGIAHAGRYRVYGRSTGQAPVDIPFDIYNAYRDFLIDATYREEHLSKMFDRPFPEMAFTYNEIRYLPEEQLNKILDCMCIEFDDSWTYKQKVENIKRALRNGSPSL